MFIFSGCSSRGKAARATLLALLYWVQRDGRMEGRRQVDKLLGTRKLKSRDEPYEDKDTIAMDLTVFSWKMQCVIEML